MDIIFYNLITFTVSFLVLVFMYKFLLKRKLKKDDQAIVRTTEMQYLKNKYNINVTKIPNEKKVNIISFINAFLISFIVMILGFIPLGIIKILIGIVLLVPLIILVYHMVAKHLKKGGY